MLDVDHSPVMGDSLEYLFYRWEESNLDKVINIGILCGVLQCIMGGTFQGEQLEAVAVQCETVGYIIPVIRKQGRLWART